MLGCIGDREECVVRVWVESQESIWIGERDLEPLHTVSTVSRFISHEVMGPDPMIFIC